MNSTSNVNNENDIEKEKDISKENPNFLRKSNLKMNTTNNIINEKFIENRDPNFLRKKRSFTRMLTSKKINKSNQKETDIKEFLDEDNFTFDDLILTLKIKPQKRNVEQMKYIRNFLTKKGYLENSINKQRSDLDNELILNCFSNYMEISFHREKEILFDVGQDADKFYVILQGKISLNIPEVNKKFFAQNEFYLYLYDLLIKNEIGLLKITIQHNELRNVTTNYQRYSFESFEDFLEYSRSDARIFFGKKIAEINNVKELQIFYSKYRRILKLLNFAENYKEIDFFTTICIDDDLFYKSSSEAEDNINNNNKEINNNNNNLYKQKSSFISKKSFIESEDIYQEEIGLEKIKQNYLEEKKLFAKRKQKKELKLKKTLLRKAAVNLDLLYLDDLMSKEIRTKTVLNLQSKLKLLKKLQKQKTDKKIEEKYIAMKNENEHNSIKMQYKIPLFIKKEIEEKEYFGDFGIESNRRERTAGAEFLQNSILGFIDKATYNEFIFKEKEKLKFKSMQEINKISFLKNILSKQFELYYFKNFQMRKCYKNEVILDQNKFVNEIFFLKEGKIDLSLNLNLFEIQDLMNNLLENLVNCGYMLDSELKKIQELDMRVIPHKRFSKDQLENLLLRKNVNLSSIKGSNVFLCEPLLLKIDSFYKINVASEKAIGYTMKVDKLNDMFINCYEAKEEFIRLAVNKSVFWLFRLNDIKISFLNLSNKKFGNVNTNDLLNEFPRFNVKNILSSVYVCNIYKQKLDEYQKIVNEFKQNLGIENNINVSKKTEKNKGNICDNDLDRENDNNISYNFNTDKDKENSVNIIKIEGRLSKNHNIMSRKDLINLQGLQGKKNLFNEKINKLNCAKKENRINSEMNNSVNNYNNNDISVFSGTEKTFDLLDNKITQTDFSNTLLSENIKKFKQQEKEKDKENIEITFDNIIDNNIDSINNTNENKIISTNKNPTNNIKNNNNTNQIPLNLNIITESNYSDIVVNTNPQKNLLKKDKDQLSQTTNNSSEGKSINTKSTNTRSTMVNTITKSTHTNFTKNFSIKNGEYFQNIIEESVSDFNPLYSSAEENQENSNDNIIIDNDYIKTKFDIFNTGQEIEVKKSKENLNENNKKKLLPLKIKNNKIHQSNIDYIKNINNFNLKNLREIKNEIDNELFNAIKKREKALSFTNDILLHDVIYENGNFNEENIIRNRNGKSVKNKKVLKLNFLHPVHNKENAEVIIDTIFDKFNNFNKDGKSVNNKDYLLSIPKKRNVNVSDNTNNNDNFNSESNCFMNNYNFIKGKILSHSNSNNKMLNNVSRKASKILKINNFNNFNNYNSNSYNFTNTNTNTLSEKDREKTILNFSNNNLTNKNLMKLSKNNSLVKSFGLINTENNNNNTEKISPEKNTIYQIDNYISKSTNNLSSNFIANAITNTNVTKFNIDNNNNNNNNNKNETLHLKISEDFLPLLNKEKEKEKEEKFAIPIIKSINRNFKKSKEKNEIDSNRSLSKLNINDSGNLISHDKVNVLSLENIVSPNSNKNLKISKNIKDLRVRVMENNLKKMKKPF